MSIYIPPSSSSSGSTGPTGPQGLSGPTGTGLTGPTGPAGGSSFTGTFNTLIAGTGFFYNLSSTGGSLNGSLGAQTPSSGNFTSITSSAGAINSIIGDTTPQQAWFSSITGTKSSIGTGSFISLIAGTGTITNLIGAVNITSGTGTFISVIAATGSFGDCTVGTLEAGGASTLNGVLVESGGLSVAGFHAASGLPTLCLGMGSLFGTPVGEISTYDGSGNNLGILISNGNQLVRTQHMTIDDGSGDLTAVNITSTNLLTANSTSISSLTAGSGLFAGNCNVEGSLVAYGANIISSSGTSLNYVSSSIGTGTFVSVYAGTGTFGNLSFSGASVNTITAGTGFFTTLNSTGGSLNGSIGAQNPNSGNFTSLGSVSGIINCIIGDTTPNAAWFTSITGTTMNMGTGSFIQLKSGTGTFNSLVIGTGTFSQLSSGSGTFINLIVGTGSFTQLNSTGSNLSSLSGTNLNYIYITGGTGVFTNLTSTGAAQFFTGITVGSYPYQLGLEPPTSSTGASIVSIEQGVGYQPIIINPPGTSTTYIGQLVVPQSINTNTLTAGTGSFISLTAGTGSFNSLTFSSANVSSISAGTGTFGNMTSGSGTFTGNVSVGGQLYISSTSGNNNKLSLYGSIANPTGYFYGFGGNGGAMQYYVANGSHTWYNQATPSSSTITVMNLDQSGNLSTSGFVSSTNVYSQSSVSIGMGGSTQNLIISCITGSNTPVSYGSINCTVPGSAYTPLLFFANSNSNGHSNLIIQGPNTNPTGPNSPYSISAANNQYLYVDGNVGITGTLAVYNNISSTGQVSASTLLPNCYMANFNTTGSPCALSSTVVNKSFVLSGNYISVPSVLVGQVFTVEAYAVGQVNSNTEGGLDIIFSSSTGAATFSSVSGWQASYSYNGSGSAQSLTFYARQTYICTSAGYWLCGCASISLNSISGGELTITQRV